MIARHILPFIQQSMADFPAVLINGARQVGKSTLAQQLYKAGFVEQYITLDDLTILRAIKEDPDGFLSQFRGPIAIDEIQRFPDLLRAIKKRIDENRQPGRFLFTGSANILSYPGVNESLAGRVDIIQLEGLSIGELSGRQRPSPFMEDLFSDLSIPDLSYKWNKYLIDVPILNSEDLYSSVFFGSFPEISLKKEIRFRDRWFSSYETAYIEKDVRDLTRLLDIVSFSKLFHLVGMQTGGLLNQKNLGAEVGLDQRTVGRYLEILELTFQVHTLPPWFSNVRKRLIKTPKIYTNDSGLACYLLGITSPKNLRENSYLGSLVETWVWSELRKLLSFTFGIECSFYRTHLGKEVDFLLRKGKQYWGIECKAATTVSHMDFKGLRDMIEAIGSQARGAIIYGGNQVIPFAENLILVPFRCLL